MYTRYSLLVLLAQAIGDVLSEAQTDRKVPLRPGLSIRDGESAAVIIPDFAVSPRNLFDVSSPVKRQGCPATCTSGFCCSDGTCVNSRTDKCCVGGFFCASTQQCCQDGCIKATDECCRSGGYCNSGTLCFLVRGAPKCCKNEACTGDLEDPQGAKTTSRTSTSTSGPSFFSTTIYTTFYVTFSTYNAILGSSILTSSATSLSTVISVLATDSRAAASSFSAATRTISFSIPASLTSPLTVPSPTSVDFDDIPVPDDEIVGGAAYPFPAGIGSAASSMFYNMFSSWRMVLVAVLAVVPGFLAVYL